MSPEKPVELLQSYVRDGSEAAFRALVDHYLPLVHAAALRHAGGNASRAEEIAQEVFIALAHKAAALGGRSTLAPWLFAATRLAALQCMRRERRRREREHKAYMMEQIATEGREIDWLRVRPLLDTLLSELDRRDQEAIFLRFFAGRTFIEIGAHLGLGEDGARLRSHRAVEKLRTLLARRGIQSTSVVLAEVLTTQFASAVPAGLAASVTATALAPAAATTGLGAVATVFYSMKASPIILGVALLAALGGAGGTLYQARQSERAEALAAALQQERDTLRAEVQALSREAAAAPPPAVGSATPTALLPSPAGTSAGRATATGSAQPASGAPPASVAALLAQIDRVLAHPELRPAFVAQIVQQLWGEDRRFFQSAGVSAAQEEAVRQEAAAYAALLLEARARRIGGENFAELFAVADEHSFAQVKRILDEDTFARLKAYKAQAGENRAVDQLAVQLYFTDTPLTGAQAGQVAELLVQNRFAPDRIAAGLTVGGRVVSGAEYAAFRSAQAGPRVALVTDAAIARAQETLPAATVAALRQLQARQLAQLLLGQPAP